MVLPALSVTAASTERVSRPRTGHDESGAHAAAARRGERGGWVCRQNRGTLSVMRRSSALPVLAAMIVSPWAASAQPASAAEPPSAPPSAPAPAPVGDGFPASPYAGAAEATVGAPAPPPPSSAGATEGGAAARLAWYDAQHQASPPQEPEPVEGKDGFHQHDGFFLRMGLGVGMGGLFVRRDDPDGWLGVGSLPRDAEDWRSAWVGQQSLSVGGCVVDNLAIYLDVRGAVDIVIPEPDDPQRSTGFVGIGLSYYFMPANLYLSGSVGPGSTVRIYYRDWYDEHRDRSHDNSAYEYYNGVGASLSLGKEWWVHDNWGVGMEAGLLYSYAAGWRDSTIWTEMHSMAVTLGVSATFN